jgi:hypothetical protein
MRRFNVPQFLFSTQELLDRDSGKFRLLSTSLLLSHGGLSPRSQKALTIATGKTLAPYAIG